MDITPFTELKIAPRAIFDTLPERRSRVRYMLPTPNGDWRAITWGAHAAQIRQIALFLGTCGLGMGDRGAVYAPNRVEWMAAALGIQAAGGVMVPVYAANTAEQAAYVVEHSDAKVVFVDTPGLLSRVLEAWPAYANVNRVVLLDDGLDAAAVLAKLRAAGKAVPSYAEVDRKLVTWSRALAAGAARDREEPAAFEQTMHAVSLDQPGVMLYTSGTSGNPKGVPLTHRNVAVNGRDWLECLISLIDDNSVDLLWLPFSHIFGFGEACLGNTLGFTTYMTEPQHLMDRLPEVRPNVFMSVPSVWEKLAIASMAAPEGKQKETLAALTGGRFKFCLSGGAGLKREVKEFFHQQGTLIIEGYGLTETSPTLTMNRPDAFRFDTVGKPFPSVEIKLAEDGEILAKGDNVFSGYHKDPAASKEAFTDDGWFKTGDVGRWTEDGFLQIIDRKKDILVTAGGKNVPPANIELRFRDDPFIEHVVVYGDGKKFLTAGVWLREDAVKAHLAERGVSAEASAAAVHELVTSRIEKVNAGLASYESIKKFAVIEVPLTINDGLLTTTLKIRRKKVYERFRDVFEGLY
ncbi:Long-chain-fatty-acid--CoA ligase [Minicystis rosea]|nr:Long-chain-fatty-acid--CoA ligase [Minicystis rosea]